MREQIDTLFFFEKMPEMQPIYEAVLDFICREFNEVTVKVQKTQISFSNRYGFAYVSLPHRRKKGCPDLCIILTFGLGYKMEHPRIMVATEPYPGRWTHHVVIQSENEIDDQIMEWLREAYHFSMIK